MGKSADARVHLKPIVLLRAPLGPGGLWVRKASRETLEKTDGM